MLWLLGCVIYLLMMATAFMGYVLPWGQMSFWGAKVITNLMGAFPVVGGPITTWLWGGFAVDNPTLNRFFSLHYLLPFVIAGVVALHIWALHVPGNNNPRGVEVKSKSDTAALPPVLHGEGRLRDFGVPDPVRRCSSSTCPTPWADADNYIAGQPAGDAARTSCPNGICCPSTRSCGPSGQADRRPRRSAGAIACCSSCPGSTPSKVRSMRYRPHGAAILLHLHRRLPAPGLLRRARAGRASIPRPDDASRSSTPTSTAITWLSRILALYYFAFFLVIMFAAGLGEKTLPVPDSISTPVLSHPAAAPAGAAAAPEKKG